jgi:hypothetical protein
MRPHKYHKYTPEEIQFLKDNIAGRSYAGLTDLFNKKFDLSQTVGKIHGFLINYNLKSGKMKYYTPEEKRFLEDNISGRTYADLTDMFNKHFELCGRKKAAMKNIKSYLSKHKIKNNGNHELSVIKHKRRPIGTEFIRHDGYRVVKTADPDVWKIKHIAIWEAANGPVPRDHLIMFADGNKLNFNLDNLLLVYRKELFTMNKNHLIFPDAEKTKNGLLIAKLKNMIADKKKEAKK